MILYWSILSRNLDLFMDLNDAIDMIFWAQKEWNKPAEYRMLWTVEVVFMTSYNCPKN